MAKMMNVVHTSERVDVVFCGECKHWSSCGDPEDGDWDIGECRNTRTGTGVDDYCSFGERRDDDGTVS